MVAPLIWLLVFDGVVVLIWWVASSVLGITAEPRLKQLMLGLVILINAVVVVAWLLALTGALPTSFLHGPSFSK